VTAEEIRAALAACQRLPAGRPKSQQLEALAAQAKETGDRRLEAQVLIALSSAYEYAAEQERMPILFGRLLQLLDQFPTELGTLSWTIHWRLKWMSFGLVRNPAVPLETAHRWLDEFSRRYRQRGYSPRPVHALRWELASHLGDDTTASAEMEASIAAPRDQMADCDACERNDWGRWRAALGDDAGALSFWAPLLSGALRCAEEPHRVLGMALLPLVRAGRLDDARGAYLRGYPLVRQNVNLIVPVGQHIEFCALTGNEARGLELLAEHAAWLTDTHVDAVKRLSFAAGVCVLLRRLTAIGYGALPVKPGPVGPGTVDSTLAALEQEIRELCDRYDARNGNTAVSDRMTSRLAQKPLLDRLPLGFPATLPPAPEPSPEAARPDGWLGTRPGTLDELVAEARRRPAAILGQVALQAGDPQAAEASAREALAGGADLLTKQETAQLSSLLAEAIGAQPGREAELVEAFLTAATCWEGLSEPDTLHNTFNAARSYARLGRPGEAAALFAEVMPRVDIPYEPAVVALTREQFGSSLGELDRHREASEQFLRAATLLQDDPRHAAAHARLAASAAESLQRSGQLAEALAAFQRAATLFRELGDDVRWARCRRSAAWLQFWDPPAPPAGPDAEPAGVTAMRAVLSDLESMTAVDPSEELVAELAATSKQLTKMLTEPDPDDEDEDDDEDE
jgi:tetratricopeptide (TPR) repeat protein